MRKREQLPLAVAAEKSKKICEILKATLELARCQTIMAYVPVRGEVNITPYWLEKWEKGKTVLLPRVEGGFIYPVVFSGWQNMKKGTFGILEPEGHPHPPEEVEAVLLPGVAFDRQGYRLGYGKGYYDRFLPHLAPRTLLLGVGFDFQLVDDVYHAEHDRPLNGVVTDQGVTWFASGLC